MSADPATQHGRRRGSPRSQERRAELTLGAISVCVLVFIGLLVAIVFTEGWPSFAHNGYYQWFLPGGDVETQLRAIFSGPTEAAHYVYHLRAWPILWDTILVTGGAVAIGLPFSIFAAIFIAELSPLPLRRILNPVVRLLAAVPSVVYGLIGILAVAPWIEHNFISQADKHSVQAIVQLTGPNLTLATLILAVMICPIMIALIASALATVPRSWVEGSEALGANRWRTTSKVSLRTVRPAIVAATVLATGRALGESIMIEMVGGSRPFAPNLADGKIFFFEPIQTLAATILANFEGLSTVPLGQTLYAMAGVLLLSCALLSLAGWAIRRLMLGRYGIGV
ncbi:MAG TPA: ABC transporter permease subunit [Solirubrobacteraceae bacterium]|nr:ABC transporter permease subunit [Solirubrobacteraceae bacterium]